MDCEIKQALNKVAKFNLEHFVSLAVQSKLLPADDHETRKEIEDLIPDCHALASYPLEDLETFFSLDKMELWGISLEPQMRDYQEYENFFTGVMYPFKKEEDAQKGFELILLLINDSLRLHRYDIEQFNANANNNDVQPPRQYIGKEVRYKKGKERIDEVNQDLKKIDEAINVLKKYGLDIPDTLQKASNDLKLFCNTKFQSKKGKTDILCNLDLAIIKPYQLLKLLQINDDGLIDEVILYIKKALDEEQIQYSNKKLRQSISSTLRLFFKEKTHR